MPLADRVEDLLGRPRWSERLEDMDVSYGTGALAELGRIVAAIGGRRALVVTDPGVRAAGHLDRAVASLEAAGIEAHTFDGVEENPSGATIDEGVADARGLDIDVVVGLGGGSALDAAKGINLILTNGGRIEDYEGSGQCPERLLPAVGVPTTAGTGSEAQSFALVSDRDSHRKIACGDPGLRFRAVVLDPELPATAPGPTRAASGLDAVSHALESFVTSCRTGASVELARTAWALLDSHLEAVLTRSDRSGHDSETWGALQLAAFFAGAAIERSMLGAAHACANPLTARYGTVHGVAVALMLPAVIRFNGGLEPDPYTDLEASDGQPGDAESLAARVESLRAIAGLPAGLAEIGVTRQALDTLAEQASRQWTLSFNPRPASRQDLLTLYEISF